MKDSKDQLRQLWQVLRDRLKCKICESGPRAGKTQWYRCLAQHQICQDCKREICPCDQVITKKHCELTEELLKQDFWQSSCSNWWRGCKEILGQNHMIVHEEDCIYRLVHCPFVNCKSKAMPFYELLEDMKKENHKHLGKEHLMKEEEKLVYQNNLSKMFWSRQSFCHPLRLMDFLSTKSFPGKKFSFFSGFLAHGTGILDWSKFRVLKKRIF